MGLEETIRIHDLLGYCIYPLYDFMSLMYYVCIDVCKDIPYNTWSNYRGKVVFISSYLGPIGRVDLSTRSLDTCEVSHKVAFHPTIQRVRRLTWCSSLP